jgi:hypothetical protein
MSTLVVDRLTAYLGLGTEAYLKFTITASYDVPARAAVTLTFPLVDNRDGRPLAWTLPRDLLERGLRAEAEHADIRVWPLGADLVAMTFGTGDNAVSITVAREALRTLLRGENH